jgi:hypothetical protein
MAHATRKQRHEFIGLMYEHSPHEWRESEPPVFIVRQADKLMRYGATLARLAEELCNGYQDAHGNWDEKRTAAAEKKQERIEAKARQVAESIGGTIKTQGDPRGNVLKIVFPDGYTNDWGREGICVPTS